MKLQLLLLCSISIIALSCSDDFDDQAELTTVNSSNIELQFSHVVNTNSFNLGQNYNNASNETYQINELKYIISNIAFIKQDETMVQIPVEDSYFIINAEDPDSFSIQLDQIPLGNYKRIEFGIGVDQSNYPLNGSDNFIPETEALEMIWSWSAGFIFVKLEGDYTNAGELTPFLYHVGSHGTNLDNYKTVSLEHTFEVNLNTTAVLPIEANIAAVFDGVHQMSLQEKDDIQVDPINAPKIAENVQNMFNIQD